MHTILRLAKAFCTWSLHIFGALDLIILICSLTPGFLLLQIASFLLYLSDVEEGGETMFPYEVRSFDLCLLMTRN